MIAAVAGWRGWKALSLLLAVSIGAYLVIFAQARAVLDWDIVAYTAATWRDGSLDAAALHARTWALVQASVPEAVFTALTDGTFRERQYRDPLAFQSQLPLYDIKLGYILTLKGLAFFVDPIVAMMVVSTASGLGVLALLVWMASKAQGIATLAWLPLAGIFGFSGLTADLAPDSMATCVYAVGAAAFLSNRTTTAILAFLLTVFIRPEGLALNIALSAFLALEKPRLAGLLAVGSMLVSGVVFALSDHVGWWGQFTYNFIAISPDLSTFRPVFSLHLYLSTLATSFKQLLHAPWFYGAIGTVLLAVVLVARTARGPAHILLPALVVGATGRFLLYPSLEIRHHWPAAFSLCLVLLAVIAKKRGAG